MEQKTAWIQIAFALSTNAHVCAQSLRLIFGWINDNFCLQTQKAFDIDVSRISLGASPWEANIWNVNLSWTAVPANV